MPTLPQFRGATWAILAWTGLMLVWAISGLQNVGPVRSTGSAVGVGIGLTFIFMVWLVGFLVLSVVWFMTKPKGAADELARLQAARDGGLLTPEQYQSAAATLAGPASGKAGQHMKCGRCGKPLSPAWVGKCQHCGARYAEFLPVPRTD